MKLFRSIRQNLIKEGKIKRYLLYAIGEILLVMIGISLAFQLDNWNDDRIKHNAEIRFYENIKEQLIDDKELIEGQKRYNNHYMPQFKYANNIIEAQDRSKIDTLGLIVRKLTQYSDFDKKGNIYETMVNSGEIKLLKNHEIINGVRELEEIYNYVNRMENIHYDAMMTIVIDDVFPVLKFDTAEIKNPDRVFNYKFQNLIAMLLQIMEEKNSTYNKALNEIDRVTKLIDEELLNK